MDLFDFFFPEQAEAAQLRRISRQLSHGSASSGAAEHAARRAADEVADLRSDVKFLTLVIAAILKRLAENETMSLADVTDLLDDIDRLDGVSDSGLEPGVLRGILGVVKQEVVQEAKAESQPEQNQLDIDVTPRLNRFRRR